MGLSFCAIDFETANAFRGSPCAVGLVRVVDVREKICGAVIQDMNSNKERIKVGDRLRVDAKQ